MPNDAKLGMVVGVCLVILVAVIFFRKDLAGTHLSPENAAVTTYSATASPRNALSPAPAKTTSDAEVDDTTEPALP